MRGSSKGPGTRRGEEERERTRGQKSRGPEASTTGRRGSAIALMPGVEIGAGYSSEVTPRKRAVSQPSPAAITKPHREAKSLRPKPSNSASEVPCLPKWAKAPRHPQGEQKPEGRAPLQFAIRVAHGVFSSHCGSSQQGAAMPYLYRAPGPQAHPVPKDAQTTHSSGQSFEQLRQECLQRGTLFEDVDFPANDSSLFYSERPRVPFVWKRPGEIVKNPEFILGGATRTDICQGELGDCWLLAAIASLTLNDKALARVVPQDQSFGPGYAGIFHFQANPRPASRLPPPPPSKGEPDGRLNGSYEALKGGSAIEAMEDFTGGVAETFLTKEAPENFYELLEKALKRGSLLGCSIDVRNAAETEARTPFGLIKGHAYTVTGVDQVNFRGQKVELIRVRNPWGQVEWNGSWSDSSPEWQSVGPAEQTRLNHTALDDGEFWMAFKDFKAQFDKVEICNLTPDALDDGALHKWEVTIHQGSWVRGSTAGACRNFLDTFWTNPQIKLSLTEKDEGQEECTFLVALMQKDRRKLKRFGANVLTIGYAIYQLFEMADTFWTNPQIKLSLTEKDEGQEECTFLVALMQKDRRKLKRFGANVLTIGYAIYQCPDGGERLDRDFFRFHASQARSKTFINLREVSGRFRLPPGEYVLIPSTFEPHQEADFCLRIFSEKRAVTQDMDGSVDIDLPEDMEVTAEELKYVLNAVLQKSRGPAQSLLLEHHSCLLNPRDQTSGNGKLELDEFKVFWTKLKEWINLFRQFDADKSGTMSSYELRTALKAAGFQLGSHLLQLVVLRYADEGLQLDFDDFLCWGGEGGSRVFQALRMKNKEFIQLNINEVWQGQGFCPGTCQGQQSPGSINSC
ncbi:Calpain-9 [Tupaia chinensis]|uniref:Calpain-9 n=1 Tax=Tupaia chinensis TaxID=246437 RepID=L9KZE0_TUPCH|nr:Calpain-9 [Tupaia chinensis]